MLPARVILLPVPGLRRHAGSFKGTAELRMPCGGSRTPGSTSQRAACSEGEADISASNISAQQPPTDCFCAPCAGLRDPDALAVVAAVEGSPRDLKFTSFGQLHRQICSVVSSLRELGFQPGESTRAGLCLWSPPFQGRQAGWLVP